MGMHRFQRAAVSSEAAKQLSTRQDRTLEAMRTQKRRSQFHFGKRKTGGS